MAYATVADVQARLNRDLTTDEQNLCAYNSEATADAKKIVSCRMVIRAMGDGADAGVPMGATQGSMSALGYSQSWTIGSGGGSGELYIGKLEKKLLGAGNAVGSYSPTEELVPQPIIWEES